MSEPALLVTDTGLALAGRTYGAKGDCLGPLVFCTSMIGYQDAIADPGNAGKIIVFTAAQIGNTGLNEGPGFEPKQIPAGVVIRQGTRLESSWLSRGSWESHLEKLGIAGICDVDTRMLTRHLRDNPGVYGGIYSGGALGHFAASIRVGAPVPTEVSAPLIKRLQAHKLTAQEG